MKTRIFGFSLFVIFSALSFFPQLAQANNLSITNVRMGTRDINAKTLSVLLDIAWDNSWKNKINHDAVWLTVRLNDVSAGGEKRLCHMALAGLDPAGVSAGSNTGLELYVPGDKVGAFIRRKDNSPVGNLISESVKFVVDYDSCGFSENSQIAVSVFGLEMVLVPEGAFYAGDNGTSSDALRQGSADNDPWSIVNEAAINATASVSDAYYYVSASSPGEFGTGASFTIPASYPKGHKAFYLMKYEITEGQWVEFFNSLPAAARSHRDLTDNLHKNSDAVVFRNTLACSGSPLLCETQRPSRALGYLKWTDLCAFLDWAGLRPMTELEFEKSARGPFVPQNGEYAWGSTDAVPAGLLSGTSEEAGDETVVTLNANARYENVLLSGGDSAVGVEHQSGPLRVGIFATSTSDRVSSGAGNYGAMELSGNVKEQVVTVGNADGLGFTGQQGDGHLTLVPGFEGNADVPAWPGMDADAAKGVTGAAGSGLRGGSWADGAGLMRVSDRTEASLAVSDASAKNGGRGVRTYDGL